MVVSPLTDEAMWFELGVLIASGLLLGLILRRHFQKRSELTMLLFMIFLFMAIAIFFMMLAKIYYLFFNAEFLTDSDPWFWFISRVLYYRFGFMFITVSILCTHIFRVKVFEAKPAKWVNYFFYAFGIFIIMWAMVFFIFKDLFLNLILFALLMIFLLLVFVPFSIQSFRQGRSTRLVARYRKAFIFLGLMGVCFIMVLMFNLFDQLAHFIDNNITYSIYYFLGWISHIIGMLFAYFGFLRPKREDTK